MYVILLPYNNKHAHTSEMFNNSNTVYLSKLTFQTMNALGNYTVIEFSEIKIP